MAPEAGAIPRPLFFDLSLSPGRSKACFQPVPYRALKGPTFLTCPYFRGVAGRGRWDENFGLVRQIRCALPLFRKRPLPEPMEAAHESKSWKDWFEAYRPKLLLCARQWTR